MAEYIDKQSVIDYLNGYLHSIGECGADSLLFDRGQRRALINSIQDILAAKAANVQPARFARWIDLDNRILCSGCGAGYDDSDEVKQNTYIFCPNCGARMDGDT